MPGRPKKPAALKKLQGTFRADRDGAKEIVEAKVAEKLPKTPLRVSGEITNSQVKKAYRDHIQLLRAIGAETRADNELLHHAYKCLELAKSYWTMIINLDPEDEMYDIYMKRYTKFFEEYSSIVQKFYLTPQARIRLTLDVMTAKEKELNIQQQEQSAISKLLNAKES